MLSLVQYVQIQIGTLISYRAIGNSATQQSMGESWNGLSMIFTFLKHLMIVLNCNFFRASFLDHVRDTGSMGNHAAQIFLTRNTVKQWL